MLNLAPEIKLVKYNQLEVLEIEHPKVKAKIALQGAHLFSWQPDHAAHDVLWLSDVEPFTTGNAIRGGVPICYPWFGGIKQPAHGYARNSVWDLLSHQVEQDKVVLDFGLKQEAKITMELGETCHITFTHLTNEQAQLALHSYFNIGDITRVEVQNLPTDCFDTLTKTRQAVPSPRKIAENVDCIYSAENHPTHFIDDEVFQRRIKIEHINASDVVLWNPWHKATSGMSEVGYKTMVCVETARINRLLQQNEQVSVKISVK
ncbi:D-hexose-6-phosphate mutarotase [Glaesserella sp.]|uniref:D-hexose-6-phosphate mutarotase n=1 Tax=Glaesserella sp. TaxID=2094731 RepID=UPI0035A094D7